MQMLEQKLSSYGNATKRSALYYLTRYVKQAAIFDDYEKDIFVEAEDSAPSENVKNLTLELIEIVEKIRRETSERFL